MCMVSVDKNKDNWTLMYFLSVLAKNLNVPSKDTFSNPSQEMFAYINKYIYVLYHCSNHKNVDSQSVY